MSIMKLRKLYQPGDKVGLYNPYSELHSYRGMVAIVNHNYTSSLVVDWVSRPDLKIAPYIREVVPV